MSLNQLIAIVGFMGCGKTAVARLVAAELNREMVDLDDLITERHGRTAAQIISEDGETQFRSIETRTLSDLLDSGFAGVLALGGGAWIESSNRKLLTKNNALTIWLNAPFEACWQRIEAEASEMIRPLAPTKDEAKSLFERRRAVYELADIHLKSSAGEGLETVALRVKEAILVSDPL